MWRKSYQQEKSKNFKIIESCKQARGVASICPSPLRKLLARGHTDPHVPTPRTAPRRNGGFDARTKNGHGRRKAAHVPLRSQLPLSAGAALAPRAATRLG